jgi:hypothetical protein
MSLELNLKKLENEKSIQAETELKSVNVSLAKLETESVNPKRLNVLLKIKSLYSTIKKNKKVDVKCPSCGVNVCDALNEPIESKLVKYSKLANVPKETENVSEYACNEITRCEKLVSKQTKLVSHKEFLESNIKPLHDLTALQLDVDYLSKFSMSNLDTDEDIDGKLDSVNRRIDALDNLKKNIGIAQVLFNKSIIDTFTLNANDFLTGFFSKPIKLIITSFTKTGRPQIDFEIVYDGYIYDLKSLSGGEFDRVLLAMTLGINKIYNIPFILLDETLGSLDIETMANVIKTVKDHYDGAIIYIGHVDDYGMFDNTIEVN